MQLVTPLPFEIKIEATGSVTWPDDIEDDDDELMEDEPAEEDGD